MGAGLNIHLHRKDGSDLSVDIQLSPIEIDGGRYSVAAVRDVAERKKVEDALRDSEERFRTLVETAPVIISTLSPGGLVTSLNKAFETVTGYRREDWVGRHFADIVDAKDVAAGFDRVRQLMEGEPVDTRERAFARNRASIGSSNRSRSHSSSEGRSSERWG